MAVATRSSGMKIRGKETRWDGEKRRENRDCAATSCKSGGGSGRRIQPLPVYLRRPKMVRLRAALTAERVLSAEHGFSTQAFLHNAGKDTTWSERSSPPRAGLGYAKRDPHGRQGFEDNGRCRGGNEDGDDCGTQFK